MKSVEFQLPDHTLLGLDREPAELAAELRVAAAVKWYEIGRVSQELAAEIAGLGRADFLLELSRLRVSPMQETAGEAMAGAKLILGS